MGAPIPLNTLDPPHPVARTVSRTTPWRRFIASTGNNSMGYVLINPFYGVTGTLMLSCGADAGVMPYGPIACSTSKTIPYTNFPDLSVNTQFTGWTDGYIAHPDGAENFTGERRWLAVEIEVNYMGTALNCGGEYLFVRNGGVVGLCHLPLETMTSARDTEIRPITQKKQRFFLTPRNVWESSFHRSTSIGVTGGRIPTNPGDEGYDPEISGYCTGDVVSDICFPHTSASQAFPAHKGWNIGLVLHSAAAGQDFQVSVRLCGEVDLTEHSAYTNTITEGATNNAVVARANPTEHAVVTTMHAHANSAVKHAGGLDKKWFMNTLRDEVAKLIPGAMASLGKGLMGSLERGVAALGV